MALGGIDRLREDPGTTTRGLLPLVEQGAELESAFAIEDEVVVLQDTRPALPRQLLRPALEFRDRIVVVAPRVSLLNSSELADPSSLGADPKLSDVDSHPEGVLRAVLFGGLRPQPSTRLAQDVTARFRAHDRFPFEFGFLPGFVVRVGVSFGVEPDAPSDSQFVCPLEVVPISGVGDRPQRTTERRPT
jgi:hypothetical protein